MKVRDVTGGVRLANSRDYSKRISFLVGFIAGMLFTLFVLAVIALFLLSKNTGSGGTAEQRANTTGAHSISKKGGLMH